MTAVIGLTAWLGALAVLPGPLIARITLGAPLVVVPQLLQWRANPGVAPRLGGPMALAAALPLLVAVALPVGLAAALFSLPWLGLCAAAAAGALWRGLPLLPGLLHPRRAVELGPHVALGFLAVGAAFVVADRLGVRPLGFSSEIVLLTATHFHFAGFGVLTIGCIVARRRSSMRFAILGLVIGFPVTAAAFVLASDALNALGAVIVGLAGSFVAIALTLVRGGGWRTWTMRLAGVALLLGVPMGIAWSWAIWLGIDFLGLDAMVRTHGVLNAVGVMLVALAYPRQPA